MIARGTAGGREPVGLLFAIDLVVHLVLNGYAPRIHVVVGGEQLRALLVLFAPLATASKRGGCLLYTSPSPRDRQKSRMPSSA